jgi:hypothetical protein
MTLVVAHAFSDGPRLVGDTQLTAETGRPNAYSAGALKVVILERGLSVGFAGGALSGQDAVLEVGAKAAAGYNPTEVTRTLRRAADRTGDEFIVATLFPEPSLTLIRRKSVTLGLANAWIGDRAAFGRFQRYFHGAGALPRVSERVRTPIISAAEQDRAQRLAPAMMQVIEDDAAPGVAGFPIFVVPTRRGFKYESVAVLAADHDQEVRPEDGWVNADWGTAAEGGFGYAVKTPDEPGIGAVGAYFPHGGFGILHYPARYRQAIAFRETTEEEFRQAVEAEFGFGFGRYSIGFRRGK